MTFYSPTEALLWLKGKIAELFAARGILQDLYGRAVIAQSKAHTPQQKIQTTQLLADIRNSLDEQSTLERRIRMVVPESWAPPTLGILPLIAGIGAVAVAGAVYVHLRNVAQHQQTLNLIEKGLLTAEQGIRLEQTGSSDGLFSGLQGVLIGGVALYALVLFGPMLAGAFKR